MNAICVERARNGNPAAMDDLLNSLRPRLTRMARYYASCSQADADDLLSEAWMGCFEALPGVDLRIGNPESYLIQYARWRVLDAIKRHSARRCHLPGDEVLDGLPAPATLEIALTTTTMAEFVTRLNATQRAILACLLAGYTWRETGRMLGCTSANVAYHVKRIQARYQEWASKNAE